MVILSILVEYSYDGIVGRLFAFVVSNDIYVGWFTTKKYLVTPENFRGGLVG